jgi:hypothetical protein
LTSGKPSDLSTQEPRTSSQLVLQTTPHLHDKHTPQPTPSGHIPPRATHPSLPPSSHPGPHTPPCHPAVAQGHTPLPATQQSPSSHSAVTQGHTPLPDTQQSPSSHSAVTQGRTPSLPPSSHPAVAQQSPRATHPPCHPAVTQQSPRAAHPSLPPSLQPNNVVLNTHLHPCPTSTYGQGHRPRHLSPSWAFAGLH